MTVAMIEKQGRWLFVPVLDEETGQAFQWDVHADCGCDWTALEPVATGSTFKDARIALSLALREARQLRRDERAMRLPAGDLTPMDYCDCHACRLWWRRLHR
jgi:hypothetical protein